MAGRYAARRIKARLVVLAAALVSPAFAAPTEEESAEEKTDPDFAQARKAIDAKDWQVAIRYLNSAALRDTRNADIHNFLGYAYRHLGQFDAAFRHYERALQLNPRHRGAHEYVGEAYLMIGRPEQAQKHLDELARICLIPCEEHDDLKKKIAEYHATKARK